MSERLRLHVDFETALSPDRVLDALIDFSDRRLELWPNIDPTKYQVHEVADGWAEVTEGNAEPPIWARERYEWTADRVSIKAIESNFCVPGDGTDIAISAGRNGGSRLAIDWEREAASPEWQRLMDAVAEMGDDMLLVTYRDRFEAMAAAGD